MAIEQYPGNVFVAVLAIDFVDHFGEFSRFSGTWLSL